jgi:hypothetical protein
MIKDTPADPCEDAVCDDMAESMYCDGDMLVMMDGHSDCVADGDSYHCEPRSHSEYCDYGCDYGHCMDKPESESSSSSSEEKECEWRDMGPGMCRGPNGEAPSNWSADGFDMEGCAEACEETMGCIGISLSQGGRCAVWMAKQPEKEHPVFGRSHASDGGWDASVRLTTTNDDDRWHCAVVKCMKEDDESCEESLMGMYYAYHEMERQIEMMKQDQEFLDRMFEQCLVRDKEVSECHDEYMWKDNQGRDCEFYDKADMCELNYLHIFADKDGHDAYTACCACGGGDAEYVRRRLTFGETCEGMSLDAEAECLRNRVNLLENTINNVGL